MQSIWRERNYRWTKSRNKLVRLLINYRKWLASASRIWSVLTVKYAGFFICKNGTRKRVHRASHTDTTPCNSVELLHTEICAACALNWMTDVLDRARGGPPSPLRSPSSLFLSLSRSLYPLPFSFSLTLHCFLCGSYARSTRTPVGEIHPRVHFTFPIRDKRLESRFRYAKCD